jgi:transposase-like protein
MAHTSKTRERAVELFARGVASTRISQELGVTTETVRRWKKLWRERRLDTQSGTVDRPAKKPRKPPPKEEEIEDSGDTLEHAKQARARTLRLSREAEAEGDIATAQKLIKEGTSLSLLIARIEKERNSGNGGITVTADELMRAEESVRRQLEAVAQYPIMCAECGRKMRVEIASGGKSDPEPAPASNGEG